MRTFLILSGAGIGAALMIVLLTWCFPRPENGREVAAIFLFGTWFGSLVSACALKYLLTEYN